MANSGILEGSVLREYKVRRIVRQRRENLAVIILFLIVVGTLELVIRAFRIPEWIVPPPSLIATALVRNFHRVILPEAIITLQEVFIGFFIGVFIGITMGSLIAQYKILDKLLSPYILLLVTMPTVALVPLLMLWFGFGIITKIIAVVIASFPPIMINTITGIANTDKLQLDLVNSLGASKIQEFIKVRFPGALPSIFGGLIIGGVNSVITAVAAEFVGGSRGLGNRLIYFASTIETRLLYALILILAIIGICIYLGISFLRSKVIRWVG